MGLRRNSGGIRGNQECVGSRAWGMRVRRAEGAGVGRVPGMRVPASSSW